MFLLYASNVLYLHFRYFSPWSKNTPDLNAGQWDWLTCCFTIGLALAGPWHLLIRRWKGWPMSEGKKGSCPLGSISKPGWHHQESKAGSGPMAIPNGQEQQIRTGNTWSLKHFFCNQGCLLLDSQSLSQLARGRMGYIGIWVTLCHLCFLSRVTLKRRALMAMRVDRVRGI